MRRACPAHRVSEGESEEAERRRQRAALVLHLQAIEGNKSRQYRRRWLSPLFLSPLSSCRHTTSSVTHTRSLDTHPSRSRFRLSPSPHPPPSLLLPPPLINRNLIACPRGETHPREGWTKIRDRAGEGGDPFMGCQRWQHSGNNTRPSPSMQSLSHCVIFFSPLSLSLSHSLFFFPSASSDRFILFSERHVHIITHTQAGRKDGKGYSFRRTMGMMNSTVINQTFIGTCQWRLAATAVSERILRLEL